MGFDVAVPDFRTRYLDLSRREGKQIQNPPRTWKRGKVSPTVAALGRNVRGPMRLAGINRASADPYLLPVEPLDEAVARRDLRYPLESLDARISGGLPCPYIINRGYGPPSSFYRRYSLCMQGGVKGDCSAQSLCRPCAFHPVDDFVARVHAELLCNECSYGCWASISVSILGPVSPGQRISDLKSGASVRPRCERILRPEWLDGRSPTCRPKSL